MASTVFETEICRVAASFPGSFPWQESWAYRDASRIVCYQIFFETGYANPGAASFKMRDPGNGVDTGECLVIAKLEIIQTQN